MGQVQACGRPRARQQSVWLRVLGANGTMGAARSGLSLLQRCESRFQRRVASVGQALFERIGRQLLRVGVMDSVPKLLTLAILQPLVDRHRDELELNCDEAPQAELLGRMVTGELDLMLADSPVPANLTRGLQALELASSGMSFMAARVMAARLARNFPQSLTDAPFLAGSAPGSLIGQALEAWFARHKLRPRSAGHIDDSALLKGFAQAGLGVIAVPSSIEAEVRQTVYLIRARGRRAHPLVAELEQKAGAK